MLTIEVRSSFENYFRFNVMVVYASLDPDGNIVEMSDTQDIIAEVGDELERAPKGFKLPRTTRLECDKAPHKSRLIVYIVPHTLPKTRDISMTPNFEVEFEVLSDGESIYFEQVMVNQWSGISKEINI